MIVKVPLALRTMLVPLLLTIINDFVKVRVILINIHAFFLEIKSFIPYVCRGVLGYFIS